MTNSIEYYLHNQQQYRLIFKIVHFSYLIDHSLNDKNEIMESPLIFTFFDVFSLFLCLNMLSNLP